MHNSLLTHHPLEVYSLPIMIKYANTLLIITQILNYIYNSLIQVSTKYGLYSIYIHKKTRLSINKFTYLQ